jgi:hypothetical protein
LDALHAATAKASVNLRGDLAKLSDAELAEHLEAAWQAVDAAQARRRGTWFFFRSWVIAPWRGPIRHPRAYRFQSLLSGGNPWWFVLLVASVFSGKQYERFLRRDMATDEYLSLCEVRDITDEIERRLAQRKAAGA